MTTSPNITSRDGTVISLNTRDYSDLRSSHSSRLSGGHTYVSSSTQSTHRTITEIWVKNPDGFEPAESLFTFNDVVIAARPGHEMRFVFVGDALAGVRNLTTKVNYYLNASVYYPKDARGAPALIGGIAGALCIMLGFGYHEYLNGFLLLFACPIVGYVIGVTVLQRRENARCQRATTALKQRIYDESKRGL
jgi:hypothetical protein